MVCPSVKYVPNADIPDCYDPSTRLFRWRHTVVVKRPFMKAHLCFSWLCHPKTIDKLECMLEFKLCMLSCPVESDVEIIAAIRYVREGKHDLCVLSCPVVNDARLAAVV